MGTISMRNIVVLLETQQRLQRMSPPPIGGYTGVQLTDYLPAESEFRSLRHVTIQLSARTTFDVQLSAIVQKSPNLQQLHLCFSGAIDYPPHDIRITLFDRTSSKGPMFSLATRLTLHGYLQLQPSADNEPVMCFLRWTIEIIYL
jgi:hypothetical protein